MRVSIHAEKVMKRGEKTYFWFTLNLKMRKLAKKRKKEKKEKKVFFAGKRAVKKLKKKGEKERREKRWYSHKWMKLFLGTQTFHFFLLLLVLTTRESYSLSFFTFWGKNEETNERNFEEIEGKEKK